MVDTYSINRSDLRVTLTSKSLYLFADTYFKHYMTLPTPPFHFSVYDLFDLHKRPAKPRYILDLEARYYGKSVRLGCFLPLWLLAHSPYGISERIVQLSNTAALAERNMRWIKRELQTNALLRADYPDLLSGLVIDRVDEMEWSDGRHLKVQGAGSQIRGYHWTTITTDDLEDRENAKNPQMREKMAEYFVADILGGVDEQTMLLLVGTIVHEQSLLNEYYLDDTNRTQGWIKLRFPAITDDGKALWPEKETLADLERLKQRMRLEHNGVAIFYQEKLLIPVPQEERAVSPEDIRYIEHLPCSHHDMHRLMACDLAFSEKKGACYTAFVCWGIPEQNTPHSGTVYCVAASRGKYEGLNKAHAFLNFFRKWRPSEILVENGPGCNDFIALLSKCAIERNLVLPTIRKVTPRNSKLERARTVSHLFQEGRIWLQDEFEQREMARELISLPHGAHSDLADAAVHGLRRIRYYLKHGLPANNKYTVEQPYISVGGY